MLDNLFTRFADIKARREEGDHGFTLIELLVVVVIIGILVAIAIPLYLNYKHGAQDDAAKSDLRNAATVIENGSQGVYPATLTSTQFQASPYNGHLSDGVSGFTYTLNTTTGGGCYCIQATSASDATAVFHLDQSSGGTGHVTAGVC